MTKLHRSNLVGIDVAHKEEFQRAMHGLKINPDGSTVACNGSILLAVSPVDEGRVVYPSVGKEVSVSEYGVVLKLDHASEALKNIPKCKNKNLHHTVLTKSRVKGNVELTSISEGSRIRSCADVSIKFPFPEWEKNVQTIAGNEVKARVCVNRKDLIKLLKAIDDACPDKGEHNPLYIEFGNGLILRSENNYTNQRALGAIGVYKVKGDDWLKKSTWEKKVFGLAGKVVKKVARKLKRRK